MAIVRIIDPISMILPWHGILLQVELATPSQSAPPLGLVQVLVLVPVSHDLEQPPHSVQAPSAERFILINLNKIILIPYLCCSEEGICIPMLSFY